MDTWRLSFDGVLVDAGELKQDLKVFGEESHQVDASKEHHASFELTWKGKGESDIQCLIYLNSRRLLQLRHRCFI
jgi:hypothetical protein